MSSQPRCMSATQQTGQRAGFCIFHGWNLSYRDLKNRGCIDPCRQRGKNSCKWLVKDADHIVWFRRLVSREKKNEAKRIRRELNRIEEGADGK